MNKLYQREDGSVWTVVDSVDAAGFTGRKNPAAAGKNAGTAPASPLAKASKGQ